MILEPAMPSCCYCEALKDRFCSLLKKMSSRLGEIDIQSLLILRFKFEALSLILSLGVIPIKHPPTTMEDGGPYVNRSGVRVNPE